MDEFGRQPDEFGRQVNLAQFQYVERSESSQKRFEKRSQVPFDHVTSTLKVEFFRLKTREEIPFPDF